MKDKDTPLRLVRKWAKMAPDCYEALDRCRRAKLNGEMDWPDWCELPLGAAFTYLACNQGCSDKEAALVASELTACWMWRQNKIIYLMDADLSAALAEQAMSVEDTDVLPSELLLHLPYPCIYIKLPFGLIEHVDGFWVWLEFDQNRPDTPELRIQYVLETLEHSVGAVLHLVDGTILDCIKDTNETIREFLEHPTEMASGVEDIRMILTAIQMILYLVSNHADIQERPTPVRVERHGKQAKIIQDKANEVRAMDVGVRIGATLRSSRYAAFSNSDSHGTGSSKRPHARRGHWHHYWVGPTDGERKLILKWTAPTFVHPDAGKEDNVVVFPVRK